MRDLSGSRVRLHSTLYRVLSAYCGAIGNAHISHLKAGRIQLKLVEQVKGRSHDLACALVGALLSMLVASIAVDLCHYSTPCNDVRFCPLSLLLFIRHDCLQ
jgi:hypothetical protein